eukprot:ANDGO_02978.mRNA.1 Copine-A
MPVDDCHSRIQLFFECHHLRNKDTFSLSDPVVVAFLLNRQTQQLVEVGRTEWQKNTLDPKFLQPITVDYSFEEVQMMRFSVYDVDDASHLQDLSRQDFLGSVDTTLSTCVAARASHLTLPLHPSGQMIVRCEEVNVGVVGTVTMDIIAQDLPKMDTFGKADPFLIFNRLMEDGSAVPVAKTEVVKNSLNPVWKPLQCSTSLLCNGDLQRPVQVDCFDWNRSGKSEYIGSFRAPMEAIVAGAVFVLWNSQTAERRKKKGKAYDGSGKVVFRNVGFVREYSFIEYIRAGYEISLLVAIDFTASNLDPVDPRSLHYWDPTGRTMNAYESAIRSIGSILEPYDSDKLFPVYGFGGKPNNGMVSHCFPIDISAPGVQGIVNAYRSALLSTVLSGPTLFEHIIRTAAGHAASKPAVYTVLLIMTDGEIHDMERTIHAIIDASALPFSIIIVGVGTADFTNMNALDADDGLLSSQGRTAQRDIVQFVPMVKFANAHPSALARETCAELPTQFLQYVRQHGITPTVLPSQQPPPFPPTS